MEVHIKRHFGAIKEGYELLEHQVWMRNEALKKKDVYSTEYNGIIGKIIGGWVDLDRLKLIGKRILVEFPEWSGTGCVITNSGITLETSYYPHVHAPRRAKVIKAGAGLGNLIGCDVYFSYLTFGCCTDYEYGYMYFEQEGRKYGIIPFERVVCSVRDGKIVCHNGNFLALPIQRDLKDIDGVTISQVTESGIQVVDLNYETHNSKEAIVFAVGEDSFLNVGDKVVMDTACDIELENEYNRSLPEKVFYVLEENVLAVIPQ